MSAPCSVSSAVKILSDYVQVGLPSQNLDEEKTSSLLSPPSLKGILTQWMSPTMKSHELAPANKLQLTATPAAGLMSSRQSGRRAKRSKASREFSKTIGNDGNFPWLKQPSTRGQVLHSVETIPVSSFLISNGAANTFASWNFVASTIPDFTSFGNVFDQYIVREIEVLIEPTITEVLVNTSDPGEWTSCIDVDDANVPTSLTDLCSYSSAQQSRGSMSHYHRFVPGVAVAVYSGAFTSFAATTSMWLDCGSPNIQHYGIKAGSTAALAPQTYLIQARVHISWRGRH